MLDVWIKMRHSANVTGGKNGIKTLWPTFTPWWIPTGPPTEEDLLCLIESHESLFCRQFYSRLRTPNWVTKIRGVIFLCLYGKTWWMDGFYRLPPAWCYVVRRHPIYWVLGWFGPIWLLPRIAFAYIYPELCTDALTSQRACNEHSLITVTWECRTLAGPHAPTGGHKSLCFTARLDR